MRKRRGQSIIEYGIVLSLIVIVLAIGMRAYLKRGIQSGLKASFDQLGSQNQDLVINPFTGLVQEEMPEGESRGAKGEWLVQSGNSRGHYSSGAEAPQLTDCRDKMYHGGELCGDEGRYTPGLENMDYYDPTDWTRHTFPVHRTGAIAVK